MRIDPDLSRDWFQASAIQARVHVALHLDKKESWCVDVDTAFPSPAGAVVVGSCNSVQDFALVQATFCSGRERRKREGPEGCAAEPTKGKDCRSSLLPAQPRSHKERRRTSTRDHELRVSRPLLSLHTRCANPLKTCFSFLFVPDQPLLISFQPVWPQITSQLTPHPHRQNAIPPTRHTQTLSIHKKGKNQPTLHIATLSTLV